MTLPHPYRAQILPVVEGMARPRWSVMIPTYNCAHYLRATLASVLQQDMGPEWMQIEVVDDCSTDDATGEGLAKLVAEMGKGRVGFFRQAQNVGHVRNFATCLQRSRGELVHLLHGDDRVCEGFYATMQQGFERAPQIGAAFCRATYADANGRELDLSPLEAESPGILANGLERLALEQRVMTPSMVVRRSVYEQVGGFDERLLCSEDWEMWVRIAATYPIWYEPAPLAIYRLHANSNTGRHLRSAQDLRYTRLAIELFRAYLPPTRAEAIERRAKQTYALSATEIAYGMMLGRDWGAAVAQLREALLCSHSWRVVQEVARLLVTGMVRNVYPLRESK